MGSFAPAQIDKISFFYPLGNTPASCFTDNLPFEQNADVLLLGCGDARSVLFTAHADINQRRKLDFTCCDNQAAVLARNVLLYALVIAKRSPKDIFNIYYSLFSTKKDIELLHDTVEELLKAAESLKTWQRSKYRAFIRFCDEDTLVEVREIWKTYCVKQRSDSQHATDLKVFKDEITKIHQCREAFLGPSIVLTAMRAAAPLALHAASDVGHLHDEFWRSTNMSRDFVAPNPTFSSGKKGTGTLHYATDPLNWFHFGAAYTPVLGDTTPRATPRTQAQRAKVMLHVKQQFYDWVESFVKRVESEKLIIRIVYGDALSVAHTLQRRVGCAIKTSANLYRHPHRPQAMNLIYDGPAQYHVIDTSNLADSLGAINLLSACAGLLNRLPTSSLYLETLVKQEKKFTDNGTRAALWRHRDDCTIVRIDTTAALDQ